MVNGQSPGTYDHYFNLFLSPQDVLLSTLKVLIFSVIVILAHCYYGFTAKGGPGGRRHRGRPLGAQRHRDHLRDGLLPQPRAVGRHHDRTGGGMTATDTRPGTGAPLIPRRPVRGATARRRTAGVVLPAGARRCWPGSRWAVYDKTFTDSATVHVETGSVGNEMHQGAM